MLHTFVRNGVDLASISADCNLCRRLHCFVQVNRHCPAAGAYDVPEHDTAKVGLQVRGVARVRDDSPTKSTNGLLPVCNHASIVCGKTKVLPDKGLS